MNEALAMQSRFLRLNPGCSFAKIKRLKARRKQDPNHLSKILAGIRTRCYNPRAASARYYADKGIECRLTLSDLRYLWQRDGAASMDRPSVDRLDSSGHYEISNCRIVEQSLNVSRAMTDYWLRRPEGVKVSSLIVAAPCGICGPAITPAQ